MSGSGDINFSGLFTCLKDITLNSLNLTSFPTAGNFYFVQNPNWSNLSNQNTVEYGTIVIGPIQIKFGNYYDTGNGGGNISYTNAFPTNTITVTGSMTESGNGVFNVSSLSNSFFNFTDGGDGSTTVYWIAIGY